MDEGPEVGAVLPELVLRLDAGALLEACELTEPPPELTCEEPELALNEPELLWEELLTPPEKPPEEECWAKRIADVRRITAMARAERRIKHLHTD